LWPPASVARPPLCVFIYLALICFFNFDFWVTATVTDPPPPLTKTGLSLSHLCSVLLLWSKRRSLISFPSIRETGERLLRERDRERDAPSSPVLGGLERQKSLFLYGLFFMDICVYIYTHTHICVYSNVASKRATAAVRECGRQM
jgi:hypothetical protein